MDKYCQNLTRPSERRLQFNGLTSGGLRYVFWALFFFALMFGVPTASFAGPCGRQWPAGLLQRGRRIRLNLNSEIRE